MNSPRHILMIKSHSMGVGDVLRSSAAWRVLRERWPQAQLHLLFLSKHPGYPTEELIGAHHLLSSAHFVTIRTGSPAQATAQRVSLTHLVQQVQDIARALQPDLIIDFEASGLRTSYLCWRAAQVCQAQTVGVGQFLGRGLFYDRVAPSVRHYVQAHGLPWPMDYTHRDFVALAALGLERGNTPIELRMTEPGQRWAERFSREAQMQPLRELPVLGINIGCGTPDALNKRPNLQNFVRAIGLALQQRPHRVLLAGAPFERDINQAFIQCYAQTWGDTRHLTDMAGQTSISELTGLLSVCDVVVSTDSGPYHMAVAMKKPTLVWFTYAEQTSFHEDPWCARLIQPDPELFARTFVELVSRPRPC